VKHHPMAGKFRFTWRRVVGAPVILQDACSSEDTQDGWMERGILFLRFTWRGRHKNGRNAEMADLKTQEIFEWGRRQRAAGREMLMPAVASISPRQIIWCTFSVKRLWEDTDGVARP
jgi:hypothetical protein